MDPYTFTGTAGDFITLTVGETAGFAGSIDAQLTLIAPSGANEALFDASAQQNVTLAESGTYVIRVTANNFVSTGSYNVSLEGLDPATPGSPVVTKGGVTSDGIGSAAEVDVFTYAGTNGESLTITLTETAGFSGSIDARVTLFAPSGAVVTSFDSTAQQTVNLTENGTYVLRVNANNFVSTGSYDLGLQ